MMKSAKDRPRGDLAGPLNRTTERRILAESEMRSNVIIIRGVSREDPAQMGLAKDDDVIEVFAADRTEPCRKGRTEGQAEPRSPC